MSRPAVLLPLFALGALWTSSAAAHCQIPCGIYDDELRALMIDEHITTIDKSMTQIRELSAANGEVDYNQIARWVANKDQHADELTDIVTYYFMAQRLKPENLEDPAKKEAYQAQLTTLHAMMVSAMKAKQTTDRAHVDKLRELLATFEVSYFGHEVERSSTH